MSISLIQEYLAQEGLDGWLLYDFHHCNDLMWEVLKIPLASHMTRRVFVWIPQNGEVVKICHAIEGHVLSFLEGVVILYKTREELRESLKQVVKGKIAMEVSGEIPAISKVDAGTFGIVQRLGVEVVSSGRLLQKFTSVLSDDQIAAHLEAAKVVSDGVEEAFSWIQKSLLQGRVLYEKDVQTFILKYFSSHGCVTNYPPIVARGANSANPHYTPQGQGDCIRKGDYILIDLWCKKKGSNGVYADITRVAIIGGNPSEKMLNAFDAVRQGQRLAVEMIEMSEEVRGCDVDTLVRDFLIERGYSENILHRLGHNITGELHGHGANFDSFETMDERALIDQTCYSIEPALYFPNEFGLRLEHDILYDKGEVRITGGVQEKLRVID